MCGGPLLRCSRDRTTLPQTTLFFFQVANHRISAAASEDSCGKNTFHPYTPRETYWMLTAPSNTPQSNFLQNNVAFTKDKKVLSFQDRFKGPGMKHFPDPCIVGHHFQQLFLVAHTDIRNCLFLIHHSPCPRY